MNALDPRRWMTCRWVLRAAFLLALSSIAPGCGLFKPTEPETPTGAALVADYSDIDKTLDTIARAVEDKGATGGQSAYLGAFATVADDGVDYVMIPLPAVVQRLQQQQVPIPNPWGPEEEQRFYPRLIVRNTASYSMRWLEDEEWSGTDGPITGDGGVKSEIYEIVAGGTLVARGRVRLTFKNSSGRWVITEWLERELAAGEDDRLTFSNLRLEP
jgi:hypothetical protein